MIFELSTVLAQGYLPSKELTFNRAGSFVLSVKQIICGDTNSLFWHTLVNYSRFIAELQSAPHMEQDERGS